MPYKDPEVRKEFKAKYYKENKPHLRSLNKTWKKTHKKQVVVSEWKTRKKLRLKILIHYSKSDPPKCVDPYKLHLSNDPFLSDTRVLSLDHINGGGRKDRKAEKSGTLFYYWLQRNNFPKGLQVLCMNCQYVKRELNKEFN